MAPAKRASTAPVAPAAAKKAKLGPVEAGCASVAVALQGAALPQGTLETALAALPFCLGQPKEERHRFQAEMVESIGAVLEAYAQRLAEAVKAAEETASAEAGRRASREAEVEQAGGEAKLHEASREDAKVALADVAEGFQAAKRALLAADENLARGERALAAAARQRDEAQALVARVGEVQGAAEAKAFIAGLQRHIKVDDSLRTAVTFTFSKAPKDRGQFDQVVLKQVAESLDRRLAELTTTLRGDEVEALRKAAEVAREDLVAQRAAQRAAAGRFTSAAEVATGAEATLAARRKELTLATRRVKDSAAVTSEAQATVELFADGPLAAFRGLRDRDGSAGAQPPVAAA